MTLIDAHPREADIYTISEASYYLSWVGNGAKVHIFQGDLPVSLCGTGPAISMFYKCRVDEICKTCRAKMEAK